MSDNVLSCLDEGRRDLVRAKQNYFGLDYLEVGADQLTLTVTMLGQAPASITKNQVRIEGGRRITGIQVIGDPQIHSSDSTGGDAVMVVKVDRPGDFSTYTLRVTAPDFDPRYSSIDFTFKIDCGTGLDCKANSDCPPVVPPAPEIDYLAKDYKSFRQLILDRLALLMPDWREQHVPDIGVALIDVLAYAGDQLSYYQDAIATEAYLQTARQRISVRRHARLMGYRLHEGCNSRVWIRIQTDRELDLSASDFFFTTTLPLPVPKTILVLSDLEQIDASAYEVFQPMEDTLHLNPALNSISFYTWDDSECCIPAGATRATLTGDAKTLGLKPGDFLLLAERIGPVTGVAGDADPAHQQVVCLTKVNAATDPLNGTAITEIHWNRQDALLFPLCISSIGRPPACPLLTDVSVAYGNIFLADHGGWIRDPQAPNPDPEIAPSTVPSVDVPQTCCAEGNPTDPVQVAGPYAPKLLRTPLTFATKLKSTCPASGLLSQDPAQAMPRITLTSTPPATVWSAQPDLLDSGSDDPDFVVEIDNNGVGNLRFGDGILGRGLDPGMQFKANYRIGNGRAGNVGANTISQIVFWRGLFSGAELTVTNPMPATGGTDPEPVENARNFAPFAFRETLLRAVTPDDYATVARTPYEAGIRRSEAQFLWTGSWYEVDVTVEPLAVALEAGAERLLERVERHLYRYRRIFHDVRVRTAQLVPIDLAISVCVKPGYLRAHVRAALLDLLSNRRLADGRLGFFHPDTLSLGQGVMVSRIIALVQAVDGVENVTVTRLRREFEGDAGELADGILRVAPWEVPQLDNDPSFPEHGIFKLTIGGGR